MCHKENYFQRLWQFDEVSHQMRIDNGGSQTPVQKSVASVGHKGNHFQVPEIMTRDSRVMRIIDDAGYQTLVQNLVSSTRHIGNHFQVPEIITKNSHEMRIDDAESQTPLQNSVSSKGFTFRFRRLWQRIYVIWEYEAGLGHQNRRCA